MKTNLSNHYCYVNQGAQVVMVIRASTTTASTSTAMIAATCELLQIPVICATFDHASRFLSCSLGERNVLQINYPSRRQLRPPTESLSACDTPYKMTGNHDLQSLVHDARKKRAILLLDVPVGGDYDGSILVDVMNLRRKESISIVWSVQSAMDVEAGCMFTHSVKPEQCMVHLHDFGFSEIKKCGRNQYFLRQFPIWQSEGLTGEMISVLKRTDHYSYLPPFPKLSKYYSDGKNYIYPDDKRPICDLLCHLYLVGEAAKKHIFDAITHELF